MQLATFIESLHLQREACYRFHQTKIFDEFLTLFLIEGRSLYA